VLHRKAGHGAADVILADSSVWIDHLRRGNAALVSALQEGSIAMHPFVIGELACGTMRRRVDVLADLGRLPRIAVAEHDEVMALVEGRRLAGTGIGWTDAHLMAAALIARVELWTLDRALDVAWQRIGAR
jgi:predicted nucleic acid-binding protein